MVSSTKNHNSLLILPCYNNSARKYRIRNLRFISIAHSTFEKLNDRPSHQS